jgi:dinuclear metal center YbgI/SA1388 family protein
MGVQIAAVTKYIDELINPKPVDDYCFNGLQLEGRSEVSRLVTGVTVCSELIQAAIEWRAEAILVHHGLFWKGDDIRLHGMRRERLKSLLKHDIAVIGYHLPLDFHSELGNNALLARALGLEFERVLGRSGVLVAKSSTPLSLAEFSSRVEGVLGQKPMLAEGTRAQITTVGICSGGANKYFDLAIEAGCDAYVTGEPGLSCFHSAREMGVHFFAAGHHATERLGVRALGEHLGEVFGIEHRFVDVANPF